MIYASCSLELCVRSHQWQREQNEVSKYQSSRSEFHFTRSNTIENGFWLLRNVFLFRWVVFLAQSFSFRLQCKFLVYFFLLFGDKLVLPTNREMLDWKSPLNNRARVCWNVNRPSMNHSNAFRSVEFNKNLSQGEEKLLEFTITHPSRERHNTSNVKRSINKNIRKACARNTRENRRWRARFRKKCRVDLINYM